MVSFAPDAITPAAIERKIRFVLKKHGAFNTDAEGNETYTVDKAKKHCFVACFIDHIGLIKGSKSEQDDVALIAVKYRNLCRLTIFAVQQLNRNQQDVVRKTHGFKLIQLNDFSGTSSFCHAAEIVIASYYPKRESDNEFGNFNMDVDNFSDRLRLLQVLKHRYGQCDYSTIVLMYGEVGKWIEIDRGYAEFDYSLYTQLPVVNTIPKFNNPITNL
jgi:hypothetical protein